MAEGIGLLKLDQEVILKTLEAYLDATIEILDDEDWMSIQEQINLLQIHKIILAVN